jgi:hypothetical protein
MKRLSTVRMKSVEDTNGNKQSMEKSDVFYKPSEKNLQVELVSAGFEDTSAVATIINSDAKNLSAPGSKFVKSSF